MKASIFLKAESRRFPLPAFAALGLALGFYPGPPLATIALACGLAAASLGNVLLRAGRERRLAALRALALACGLASGAALAWTEAGSPSASSFASGGELSPAWVSGRLASDSSPAKNGFRSYLIRVERLGFVGPGLSAELSFPQPRCRPRLRVLARAGAEVDQGSLVRVRGRLSPASPGSAFPEPAFFAQASDIELVDPGSALDRARSACREACRAALARVGKKSAGLLQALILGVRDSLAPEESEAFKAAGCSHILALSGEHLSVLAVLAIAALRPLVGPLRSRIGGAILASLFMWIAGAGPSLLRSVLMVWIGAAALALDRPQLWLCSLALAFLATTALDPASSRSLSFTLSYLAVLGLAVLGPRFSFALGRALLPFLRESASSALAAQVAVSPLLAASFGYLQLAGIPASMAAGPIVTATMWWGMGAAALCSVFPGLAVLARPVSELLYGLLMGIMNAAAAAPKLDLQSPLSRLAASLAVVGLAALVYARPYAEYRTPRRLRGRARLRFAPGPSGAARGGRPRDVQALRPELPR